MIIQRKLFIKQLYNEGFQRLDLDEYHYLVYSTNTIRIAFDFTPDLFVNEFAVESNISNDCFYYVGNIEIINLSDIISIMNNECDEDNRHLIKEVEKIPFFRKLKIEKLLKFNTRL